MFTDVKITSNALVLIGDYPITSWAESGAGASTAKELYLSTKQAFLTSFKWTWATKSQRLNVLSEEPDSLRNFKYALQLPVDCLKLWRILPAGTNYELEGSTVYSNSNELLATYTYDVTESLIPSVAETALEYLLASKFAVSVTESVSKSDDMLIKYERQAVIARAEDAQNHPAVQIVDSPFTDARYDGYYGWGR